MAVHSCCRALELLFVPIFISVLTTTTTTTVAAADDKEFCNCIYTVPIDWEPDCRVYGQLGDGNLIPWYRASQECLDERNIKVEAMDRETLWNICPFANHTNADIQLLMNEIKFNPSPSTRAIQAFHSEFWVESTVTPGSYEFLDTIYNAQNSPVDCESSATLCWGTVREYFTVTPEATDDACKEFHDRQIMNIELEQATIRINLCNDATATTNCEPLQSQVAQIKSANPSKACSAFGLGPAAYASSLPVCENGQLVSNSNTTDKSGAVQVGNIPRDIIWWTTTLLWMGAMLY